MATKGKIKRLFPGGNTSVGFFSYYQYVIDLKEANRLYLLKGGPGVGKSSLMKKIGHGMVERGYDIEFHHCSADPEGVDAVVIPALKVAIIDGTSPHVIDPKFPGAVDEIINLGEHWNEEDLRANRDDIISSTEHNGKIYKRVYKFLSAAKIIHDDVEWIYQEASNQLKTTEESQEFIKKIIKGTKQQSKLPKERHLFGSAYTFFGHIHHRETYLEDTKKLYSVVGSSSQRKSDILKKIADKYLEKGYDVDFYHEPLVPERLESIVIPEASVAITSYRQEQAKKILDLDEYMNTDILNKYAEELEISQGYFTLLLEQVYENLKKTKKNHDGMEEYYIPNIRFEEINDVTNKLLEKILNL